MRKKGKPKRTLVIASYGLEPKHITLETLGALKKCRVVFSDCLDGGKGDFIVKACARFESLRGLSQDEAVGRVRGALREHGLAGFITYGNPFFMNAALARLKKELEADGVRINVLPAVSSFDSIINLMDLNRFSVGGLRLVDVPAAIDALSFTPEMDTLFFVVGEINVRGREKDMACFLRGLSSAYPGGHQVSVINCPTIENAAGRLLKTTVSKLKTVISRIDKVSTILVPAVK